MRKLFNDEAGFIISGELVIVLTIMVLATVVGLASIRDSISAELVDVSNAFAGLDQSFNFRSISKASTTGNHGQASGSGFNDGADDCDCAALTFTAVTGKTAGNATGE